MLLELQTILWFAVTIIGVAAVSGNFLQWRIIDKAIALLVFVGLAWLMVRTHN